jgi:uncharacterized membrane protein
MTFLIIALVILLVGIIGAVINMGLGARSVWNGNDAAVGRTFGLHALFGAMYVVGGILTIVALVLLFV